MITLQYYDFKNGQEGVTPCMPYNRTHAGGLLEKEGERAEKGAEGGAETKCYKTT